MAKTGTNKITSFDVAERAGVSQTTVSLILSHRPGNNFTEETRERVFRAAEELGYRLPQRKHHLQSRLILVMIPTLTNQYYGELVQSLEQYCDTIGYRTIICNTFRKAELEKFYLDKFARDRISGIIYTFLPSFPAEVAELAHRMPIVLVGEKTEELPICSIGLSNSRAGAMMAEHLFELGHRRVTFISTPMDRMTLARRQRLDGLREKMRELGEKAGEETHVTLCTSPDDSEQDALPGGIPFEYGIGKRLTDELIAGHTDSTAFIGANDMIALGICGSLREQGLSIPQDYSVCGFDNIFPSSMVTPGLTTVDHCLLARCRAAVNLIEEQSSAGSATPPGGNMADKIEFAPCFIPRGSTGPAR